MFCAVGRCRGDQLPRLFVLAANQHDGRMRAGIGEDLVGPVVTRSDVFFTHASGVDGALCAFQSGQQAHESDHP